MADTSAAARCTKSSAALSGGGSASLINQQTRQQHTKTINKAICHTLHIHWDVSAGCTVKVNNQREHLGVLSTGRRSSRSSSNRSKNGVSIHINTSGHKSSQIITSFQANAICFKSVLPCSGLLILLESSAKHLIKYLDQADSGAQLFTCAELTAEKTCFLSAFVSSPQEQNTTGGSLAALAGGRSDVLVET